MQETLNQVASDLIDPAFAYAPTGPLYRPGSCDPLDAWRFLSSAVARDPLDLESHARRVALAASSQHAGQTFTALMDVFLALGDKGRNLRTQLLEMATPSLSSEDADFFRQALISGLSRGAGLPMGTHSVLDPGLMGRLDMVAHQRQQAAAQSVAEQAAALVDQGDLAAARQLLEEAVLQNPDDLEASHELLGIYRHSRDSQAQQLMRDKLTARFGRTPAPWA